MGVVQSQRNKNGCHDKHISQILEVIAFLKREDAELHIHLTFCDQ